MEARAPRENRYQAEIEALEAEFGQLDPESMPNTHKLIRKELFKLRGGVGDIVDILEPTKIRTKLAIPFDNFPSVNLIGRIMGPKASILNGLMERTKTKIAILGAGSTRDESKEAEMLNSGDPKYSHLLDKTYIQIDSTGQASEAFYKTCYAIAEIKKAMIPDPSELDNSNNYSFGNESNMSAPYAGGRGMTGANDYSGMSGGFAQGDPNMGYNQQQGNYNRGGGNSFGLGYAASRGGNRGGNGGKIMGRGVGGGRGAAGGRPFRSRPYQRS